MSSLNFPVNAKPNVESCDDLWRHTLAITFWTARVYRSLYKISSETNFGPVEKLSSWVFHALHILGCKKRLSTGPVIKKWKSSKGKISHWVLKSRAISLCWLLTTRVRAPILSNRLRKTFSGETLCSVVERYSSIQIFGRHLPSKTFPQRKKVIPFKNKKVKKEEKEENLADWQSGQYYFELYGRA